MDRRGVMKKSDDNSRRQFLQSMTAAGLGIATSGTMIGTAQAATSVQPESWDEETDVIVLGYGAAGAAAAITAHDDGAQVLLLEKQAADAHTCNSKLCFGVFLTPDNKDDAIAYMKVASRVNVDMPESQDIDDAMITVWAEEMGRNNAWLSELGAPGFVLFAAQGRDANWPGNNAIKAYQIAGSDGRGEVGTGMFDFLHEKVVGRGIDIRWSTPARSLVSKDGEVVGVVARKDGHDVYIRARRAVVLSTGGFNADEKALKTYLPAFPMTFYGNPDNTGDGLRMAQALGADLWHMTVLGGGFKSKFDDFPTAFVLSFGSDAHIVVDKSGRRFKAENHLGGYSGYWNALVYDTVANTWPRIPSWLIFDERRRTAGPLTSTMFGAAGPTAMYEWSADNSREIERGWILQADSIEELAGKMGMEADVLTAEVERYNGFAADRHDADHGRMAQQLIALDRPPYYAMQLLPGLNNTFGGPRRNARAQILDVFGDPIPRLYSAGELGSLYVQYPQGGANVGECFAFGRIAGRNAAAEQA